MFDNMTQGHAGSATPGRNSVKGGPLRFGISPHLPKEREMDQAEPDEDRVRAARELTNGKGPSEKPALFALTEELRRTGGGIQNCLMRLEAAASRVGCGEYGEDKVDGLGPADAPDAVSQLAGILRSYRQLHDRFDALAGRLEGVA